MPEEEKQDIVQRQMRKKRVQRLKKLIILCLIVAILIPTILCIILFVKLGKMEKQIENLEVRHQERIRAESYMLEKHMAVNDQNTAQSDVSLLSDEEKMNVEQNTTKKKINVYLTFDDGPSDNTEEILDILKEYQVKATFFVVGKTKEYAPLYKRIVEEGHTIGMHSYSHRYNEIYRDVESFGNDVKKLQDLIFEETGVLSKVYRFPGGSSNTVSKTDMKELIAYLDEQDITYYDWNVSSLDATSRSLSVNDIVENVTGNIQFYNNAIVLMHDANDKISTVESLPIIIEKFQAMENVELLPINEDTVKIQHTTLEDI